MLAGYTHAPRQFTSGLQAVIDQIRPARLYTKDLLKHVQDGDEFSSTYLEFFLCPAIHFKTGISQSKSS